MSSCWRSSAATQRQAGSLAGSGSAGLGPRPSRAQTSRLGLGLRLSLTLSLSLSLSLSGQPLAAPQRAWQSFCSLLDCWWSHCSARPPASRRRQPVAGAREGGGEQTVALHCWVTEELPAEC